MNVSRFVSLICVFAVSTRVLAKEELLGLADPANWQQPPSNATLIAAAPPAGRDGRAGAVLQFTTDQGRLFYTRTGCLTGDLAQAEALTFWVYRAPGEATATNYPVIEVQFLEPDGRAKFWRRLDLRETGWSQQIVPLRFMAWSPQRSPRWQNVRHLGLYFRTPATLWLEALTLTRDTGTNATFSAKELANIAFPATAPAAVQVADKPEFLLLTDAPQLDLNQLEDRLQKFLRTARTDLPFLGAPVTRPVLLIFQQPTDYQQFTPRYAKLLNLTGAPPTSGGYTVQAIATSAWDPAQGTLRPVYVHEFAHAWLDRVAALPSGASDWLQEGFANHYQLVFHPQTNFPQIVRDGIARANAHLPLEQLCSGKRVPLNRYWQAATVFRFLLTSPKYKQHLPALFAAFQKTASTDLAPHLGSILKTDWEQFTADWLEFCRQVEGGGPPSANSANRSRSVFD
jgi:hypothetical protein